MHRFIKNPSDFPAVLFILPLDDVKEINLFDTAVKAYIPDDSSNTVPFKEAVFTKSSLTGFRPHPNFKPLKTYKTANVKYANSELTQLRELLTSKGAKYSFDDTKAFVCEDGYFLGIYLTLLFILLDVNTLTCNTNCPPNFTVVPGSGHGLNSVRTGVCSLPCSNLQYPYNSNTNCPSDQADIANLAEFYFSKCPADMIYFNYKCYIKENSELCILLPKLT